MTNLSEETTEADLDSMFRPFGSISRIFLAKDKDTYRSKGTLFISFSLSPIFLSVALGFAFVNFMNRRDAQAAMDALNGKGWDYLILNIEWAECVRFIKSLLIALISSFL